VRRSHLNLGVDARRIVVSARHTRVHPTYRLRRSQPAVADTPKRGIRLVERKARITEQLVSGEPLAVGPHRWAGGLANPTDSPCAVLPVDHERGELQRWPLRTTALALVEQPGDPCLRVAAHECEL